MFKPKSYVVGHPNPMFYRENYALLNGEWDFILDFKNKYEKLEIYKNFVSHEKINVPYAYNSKLSNVLSDEISNYVWYHKEIEISSLDNDVILHLEGADYYTKVWVNGKLIGTDQGAYHRLSFDITNALIIGKNDIVIKCEDSYKRSQPRGKQCSRKKNWLCFYEQVVGIYKDVWLEFVSKERIVDFLVTPSFKNQNYSIMIDTIGSISSLTVKTSYKGELVSEVEVDVDENTSYAVINLKDSFHPWDVLKPELYDIELVYGDDHVYSYVGIRDIEIKNKKIYLNDHELYQKLILDQGYIQDGFYTLTDSELENDITSMISMGFNGARKHQKREKDIFYSLADFYGYLVWAEMPSTFTFTKKSRANMVREWTEILEELYNHPSIITWTPINESWGLSFIKCDRRRAKFGAYMHKLTKNYDSTRPSLSNDGWEHSESDCLTIHLYNQDSEGLKNDIDLAINKGIIKSFVKKKVVCKGYNMSNKPILLTEFGGTAYSSNVEGEWGYGTSVKSSEEYIQRLNSLFDVVKKDERIVGYCYTQLSDVRQEINGLYSMNRTKKISEEEMSKIQE